MLITPVSVAISAITIPYSLALCNLEVGISTGYLQRPCLYGQMEALDRNTGICSLSPPPCLL